MPAVAIATSDLAPFATIDATKAQAMIDDALGLAAFYAPCITSDTFEHDAAAKAIIRQAILRWNDQGSGAATTLQAGPYGQTFDTRTTRFGTFTQREIQQLQNMCKDSSGAFAIDLLDCSTSIVHADVCSINLGSTSCSCGAILTAHAALWETGGAC